MSSDPATSRRRSRRRGGPRWYFWALLPLVLLAAAAVWISHTYLFVGGSFYRRDVPALDLRQKSLSADAYERLREELPGCDILWDVPLGDSAYDCRAESIELTSFHPGDEANLRYFRALRAIDARKAPLTAEQFEALRAALPGADILWSIPIGGARYPSDAVSIRLGDFGVDELGMFRYFEDLREIDALDSSSYDALMALRQQLPGVELSWRVPFEGSEYLQNAAAIAVNDPATTWQELDRALSLLPEVEEVSVPECPWTEEEKAALAEKYPDVVFRWPVTLRGQRFTGEQEEISFAGESLTEEDIREMVEKLRSFPALRTVDLTGCGLPNEKIYPLCDAYPELDVIWSFDLLGVPVTTLDTEIDLSGIPMESTEPVESILPYMHHLQKVDMSDCGFSDEEMDALNKRYGEVRFVWTLHIMYYKIRTDAAAFRASSSHYSTFTDETIRKLAYCEDMVALDLGHRMVTTLDFVSSMPHLKYLILMQCYAMDLSPLSTCHELIWLELNLSLATDISPLKECAKLHDLNITFMPLDSQTACDTIAAMPWLERLWYSNAQFSREQLETMAAANPSLVMHGVGDPLFSCEDPWRHDQDYYDMRDVMNMFYMDDSGRINYKIIDGVRYELDPEFIANQGDTSHDRDR